jgi:hypothetical protein
MQHAMSGQGDNLGKATITYLANVTHLHADIGAICQTGRTRAAANSGIRYNQFSGTETCHLATDLENLSSEFMTRNDWHATDPLSGPKIMQIRAADACRADLQADAVYGKRARRGHLLVA